MTKEEELEKEANQSYLDNTDNMQWDAEGNFDYVRGYLNGAEPREKKIEELEQELEKSIMALGSLRTFSNEQAISIEKLAQENAELRSGCGMCYSKDKDLLTKATEIIKELLDTQYQLDPYRDVFKTRVLKAEQFLEEIGK